MNKELLVQYLNDNKSYSEIATLEGITPTSVIYWVKKFDLYQKKNFISNNIQDWIKQNCLTRNNRLINWVQKDTWWTNRDFVNKKHEIFSLVEHLNITNIAQALYHVYHQQYDSKGICKHCQNETQFHNFATGYRQYCSIQCVTQSEERNEKIRQTVDYAELHKRQKENNLKKYGVEYFFQTKQFHQKAKQTKISRYGNENFNNAELAKQNKLNKTGHLNGKFTLDADKIKLLYLEKKLTCAEIAEQFHVSGSAVQNFLISCGVELNEKRNSSKEERQILSLLESNNINKIKKNTRNIIPPYELDIFVPEKNIAIELNGVFWHSFDSIESKEQKQKHHNKYALCKEKNIRLIQFTDEEWHNKRQICESIIKNSIGIISCTMPNY